MKLSEKITRNLAVLSGVAGVLVIVDLMVPPSNMDKTVVVNKRMIGENQKVHRVDASSISGKSVYREVVSPEMYDHIGIGDTIAFMISTVFGAPKLLLLGAVKETAYENRNSIYMAAISLILLFPLLVFKKDLKWKAKPMFWGAYVVAVGGSLILWLKLLIRLISTKSA